MSTFTNTDRAEVARSAAHHFAGLTNQISAGDWEHDRGSVYSDLIADILHAAEEDGLDPRTMLRRGAGHYQEEKSIEREESGEVALPWPVFPEITEHAVDSAVIEILEFYGETGARNVDVWTALGLDRVTDKKQWVSYRSLERLQASGVVEKRAVTVEGRAKPQQRYFLVEDDYATWGEGTRVLWRSPGGEDTDPDCTGTIQASEWSGRVSIVWDDGKVSADLKPGEPTHLWERIERMDDTTGKV